MNLRQRGIYCLPNGRELVVLEKFENTHYQFKLGGWGQFEFSEYVINEVGRLLFQGRLTAWDVNDLADTGRTANEVS